MIRKILLIVVAVLSVGSMSAQGIGGGSRPGDNVIGRTVLKNYVFSIGPKLGVNYSLSGNPDGYDFDVAGGIGFTGGVALNMRFARPEGRPVGTERFGVQLEALYSMTSISAADETISMHGFEVPVLFQWYAHPSVFVELGPTFTGVFSSSPNSIKDSNATIMASKLKPFDIKLSVGVGYKHKSGFAVGVRYNHGFGEIAKDFNSKVSTISLGLSYMFDVVK